MTKFEFTIETVGVIAPSHTYFKYESLSDKLKNTVMELEKALSSKPSTIKIKESESVMKAFDVIIDGESHTLGHLPSYINKNIKTDRYLLVI